MLKKLIIIFIVGFFLSACEDDVGDGSECSRCEKDSDCNDGMTCRSFYNSSGIREFCSTYSCNIYGCSGTSSCP